MSELDKMRQAAASKPKKEEFIPGIISDNEMDKARAANPPKTAGPKERSERHIPMTVTQKEQMENPNVLSVPGLDDIPATSPVSDPVRRKPAVLPQNPPDPNIHESPEKDILEGPDSMWGKYIEKKQQEAKEYIEERFGKNDALPRQQIAKDIEKVDDDYDPEVEELEKSYAQQEDAPRRIITPADRHGIGNSDWDRDHQDDEMPSPENFKGMDLSEELKDAPEVETLPEDEVEDDFEPSHVEVDMDYSDENDEDAEMEEEDDTPEIKTFEVDAPVKESNDDLDLEEDVDEDEENAEEDENRLQDLKNQITKCITPAAMKRNISHFTVAKKCTTGNPVINKTKKSAAKWVLPNSAEIVEMSEFDGTEIDYLRDNQGNDPTEIRNRLRTIYDHIVSPKPASFEGWLKSVAYTDYDHLFFAAYIASFSGSNYIPYTCEPETKGRKKVGCKKMFLSGNMDIMSLVKFKNKKGKAAFNELYASNRINNKGLYVTEILPISDNYAVELKVPSLWSVLFENSTYTAKFREDYSRTIQFMPYVDNFYQIDAENEQLIPIGYQVFANNQGKTAKSRVICYSKIINSLTTDEYSNLFAIVNSIDERADWFEYQRPEIECPECGRKLEAEPTTAFRMLFTRHRLAVLANTSIK